MRRAALILAAILLLSSCSPDIPDEPALSVSATEEITSSDESTDSPPPETDEITDEITEEITEEVTEETTEEETTAPGIETLGAKEILLLSDSRADAYRSFIRNSKTSISLDVLGSASSTETESELRVNDKNASFRRSGEDGLEYLYLIGNELYYECSVGKCRIGGYDRGTFIDYISDFAITNSFLGGEVARDEDTVILTFSELDDAGRDEIITMLSLPDGYSVSFGETKLEIRVDDNANLLSSAMSLILSVSMNEEKLMDVGISVSTAQTDIDGDVALELPASEEYVFFKDRKSLELYSALIEEISDFTGSHNKFEYSVSDDMRIGTLMLRSDTVYAYDKRIGVSIDKAFDKGDGTGLHTTLTHFNYRRGFSQIDGGSIFVDTTVNAGNLEFTLAYPFTTSFFTFENCVGMDVSLSNDSALFFTLNEKAVKNIASNLLLRAGIYSTDPSLSDTKAHTFIKLDKNGDFTSIGYEFSATVTVSSKKYTLTRSVELKIVSRTDSNVKVIYIETEDGE